MREYLVRCDLSGEAGAETYKIVVNDKAVTIDLAKPEFDKLMKYLDKYFAAGTVVERKPTTGPDPEREAIRQWAQAHGYTVAVKGRVSQEVMNAYQRAIEAAEATQAQA